MLPILRIPLFLLALSILMGCDSFLEEKPDRKLVVPSTLRDVQALLDYQNHLNNSVPNAPEVSADDYYVTDADWASLSTEEARRMYTWEKDRVFATGVNDWSNLYRAVYATNTVLETLEKIDRGPSNREQWENVKGQALYHRSSCFLWAVFAWAPAYSAATAPTAMGIPMRLSSDFNLPSFRPSLEENYSRILADLKEAVRLLPPLPLHPVRPSRPAAFGLLARAYLAMGDYRNTGLYADSSLRLQSALLNYNTLNGASTFPFERYHREIILDNSLTGNALINIGRAKITPALHSSYQTNDLRRTLFFRPNPDGSFGFKGSSSGNVAGLFSGVATDEVYLMRAEANARLGNTQEALKDLNTLLVTRWKTGTFVPLTAASGQEALNLILAERRKQLLMRGLRWMDLKRLNRDGANITLSRTVQGKLYTLPPNDPRYALPLPEDIIERSTMPQNPR